MRSEQAQEGEAHRSSSSGLRLVYTTGPQDAGSRRHRRLRCDTHFAELTGGGALTESAEEFGLIPVLQAG